VTTGEFLEPLDIQPREVEATAADRGDWSSGMVYITVVRYSSFANVDTTVDAGARSDAFERAITDGFRTAGRFLDRRQPEITAGMRAVGLSLRLFVEVRMDLDQMELEFPAEFLAQCGRHGLSLYVISNDL
jgi:hypothetical protein